MESAALKGAEKENTAAWGFSCSAFSVLQFNFVTAFTITKIIGNEYIFTVESEASQAGICKQPGL